ncbi:MAG: efflux RND transporter periplasmic adaptor subunit [Thermaceae bacterium]|nr:efflux RND transporter periplasmic adaptor subunit [Thermaceae bacterium]
MKAAMSPVQKRKNRRLLPWQLLGLLVLVAIGVAVFLRHPASSQTQTKVQTATATQGTFRVSVTGPGTLVAHQSVDFKPQVQGTILYLPKVGDSVTKGQLLVRLDPTTYQRAVDNAQLALDKAQAQLESARASQTSSIASQQQAIASAEAAYANAQTALASAKTNLESAKRIFAIGGNTQQEMDTAQSSYNQAQANLQSTKVALETAKALLPLKQSSNSQDLLNLQMALDQAALTLKNAQQDLSNTKLYATFNGTVSAVNAQVGGVGVSASVAGSGALLTVIDDSSIDLPVQIDETEISQVKVGQKANVTLDAFGNQVFKGTVTAISPSATVIQNIAVFYVTVNIPNPQHLLKAGMTAEGEIVSQELPNAVQIPLRAVQTVRNRSYVKVQKADRSTEERQVSVGPNDGINMVITSGLQAGETVVLPTRAPTQTQGFPGGGP